MSGCLLGRDHNNFHRDPLVCIVHVFISKSALRVRVLSSQRFRGVEVESSSVGLLH